MLAKLVDATAASTLEGFTAKLRSIAEPMRQTLTYDQGKEMARHAELSANTGIKVYFCDPPVPAQGHGPVGLQPGTARPRAIHGFYPPISVYQAMLEKVSQPQSSIQ
jgi:IS30 family transposase